MVLGCLGVAQETKQDVQAARDAHLQSSQDTTQINEYKLDTTLAKMLSRFGGAGLALLAFVLICALASDSITPNPLIRMIAYGLAAGLVFMAITRLVL